MTDYDSDYDSDSDSYYWTDSDSDSEDDMIVSIFETITHGNSLGDYNPIYATSYLREVFNKISNISVFINTHNFYKPTYLDDNYDNFLKTAVIYFKPEIVKILIEYKININILDSEGLTPLDILYKNLYEDEDDPEYSGELTEKGWRSFYIIENMLLENGAMTKKEIVRRVIRLQRRIRKNMKIKRAKRNLAYSKSYLDKRLNRKPERLSELAPDLLENISKYM